MSDFYDSSCRLRVLTWHVHGNYLYYLSQTTHEFSGWTLLYLASAVVHHFPSPSRHVSDRRRGRLRNALWVAWMRRPIRYACRETGRALRLAIGDPILARGFVEALAGMSWVLRRRRVLSHAVESQLRLLEGQTNSFQPSEPRSVLTPEVRPAPEPPLHNRLSS